MPLSSERIKKYRRWFGWTFVASLLVTMGLATHMGRDQAVHDCES